MEAVRREENRTIEDIYALPEGRRAELIDGRIYDMAPPGRTHQRLLLSMSRKIADYIDRHSGSCEVYPAPFGVFLNGDEDYVEPDISVICDLSKLDERGCHGAPDWVIEIVSPGNKSMDYFTKLFKYKDAGVREYWIVDPARERVIAYRFEQDGGGEYGFGEEVPVGIYEGFSLTIP